MTEVLHRIQLVFPTFPSPFITINQAAYEVNYTSTVIPVP